MNDFEKEEFIRNYKEEVKKNKEKYYKLMAPLFEKGVVKEIYSTDTTCILMYGEVHYMVSPFLVMENEPLGFYVTSECLTEFILDDALIYSYQHSILQDAAKNRKYIYQLIPKHIDPLLDYIKACEDLNICQIDYELNEKLAKLANGELTIEDIASPEDITDSENATYSENITDSKNSERPKSCGFFSKIKNLFEF